MNEAIHCSEEIPKELIAQLLECPEFALLGNLLIDHENRHQHDHSKVRLSPRVSRSTARSRQTTVGLDLPPTREFNALTSLTKKVEASSSSNHRPVLHQHMEMSDSKSDRKSLDSQTTVRQGKIRGGLKQGTPSMPRDSSRARNDSRVHDPSRGHGAQSTERELESDDDFREAEQEEPYTPDFENSVIQKQRRELQQLVAELRERDRELNDLVSGHQRQMGGWEADRRRLIQVEEKVRKLEGELAERQTQVKSLVTKIENGENKLQEKIGEISRYKCSLESLNKDSDQQRLVIAQIEEQNEALERRMQQLSETIEQLEVKEQELKTEIRVKDAELHKREQEVHDLVNRWKLAEETLSAHNQSFDTLNHQLREANACLSEAQRRNEQVKEEYARLTNESKDCLNANEKLQNETIQLRKDLQLAFERERRKDDLIQSQRLKQERSNSELSHLRQLYERMQRDLSILQTSLGTPRAHVPNQQKNQYGQQMDSNSTLSNPENNPCWTLHSSHLASRPPPSPLYPDMPTTQRPPISSAFVHSNSNMMPPARSSSTTPGTSSSRLVGATASTNQLLQQLITSRGQTQEQIQGSTKIVVSLPPQTPGGATLFRMTSLPDMQSLTRKEFDVPLNSCSAVGGFLGPGETAAQQQFPYSASLSDRTHNSSTSTNPFAPTMIRDMSAGGEDIAQKLNRIMCQ